MFISLLFGAGIAIQPIPGTIQFGPIASGYSSACRECRVELFPRFTVEELRELCAKAASPAGLQAYPGAIPLTVGRPFRLDDVIGVLAHGANGEVLPRSPIDLAVEVSSTPYLDCRDFADNGGSCVPVAAGSFLLRVDAMCNCADPAIVRLVIAPSVPPPAPPPS